MKSAGLSVAALVAVLASGVTAQAAAIRTFVASTGNDANTASNCAATTPCRTLAQAFSVTSTNGEITILDAGGFGALTINRAVSIVGTAGALVGVPAGGTGITVAVGSSDVVYLSNLLISGGGVGTNTGIALTSGKLAVQNVNFKNLATGLSVTSSKADVVNSEFIGNGTAILTNGAGAAYNSIFFACPCTTLVRINGGNLINNTTVFTENNPTVVSGSATATIFIFQSGTQFSANITGFTTMMALTGTGSGGTNPGPQTYGGVSAPN